MIIKFDGRVHQVETGSDGKVYSTVRFTDPRENYWPQSLLIPGELPLNAKVFISVQTEQNLGVVLDFENRPQNDVSNSKQST